MLRRSEVRLAEESANHTFGGTPAGERPGDPQDSRERIYVEGGLTPVWAPDQSALYFVQSRGRQVMRVAAPRDRVAAWDTPEVAVEQMCDLRKREGRVRPRRRAHPSLRPRPAAGW